MHNELEAMSKEVSIVKFRVLSSHIFGGTKEKPQMLPIMVPCVWDGFELRPSK
jgi:hypothetical protein